MSNTKPRESDVTKNDRAIEALLSCSTLAEAARKADIPYSSFRRLMYDPAFQAELRQARCAVLDGALVYLRGMAQKAVQVVEETLDGKAVTGIRLSAAKWVLEKGLEGLVSDLTDRVTELEEEKRRNTNA